MLFDFVNVESSYIDFYGGFFSPLLKWQTVAYRIDSAFYPYKQCSLIRHMHLHVANLHAKTSTELTQSKAENGCSKRFAFMEIEWIFAVAVAAFIHFMEILQ